MECTIPNVGDIVLFYTTLFREGETDTGIVLKIIDNDSDDENPILQIKPDNMKYDIIYRTVKEII